MNDDDRGLGAGRPENVRADGWRPGAAEEFMQFSHRVGACLTHL